MKKNDLTQLLAILRKYNKLDCITKVRHYYGDYFITLSSREINKCEGHTDYEDLGITYWLRDNTKMLIGENGMFLYSTNMFIYIK